MTNKELGKMIWNSINFNNYYSEDFESWYKDCFGECINDAANSILNGSCEFEKGSFVEISSAYTKSGNPETFDVDKENFIEFYGVEDCKNLFNIKEANIEKLNISNQKDFNELVWNYGASGTKIFNEYQLSNEQKEIISSAWSEYVNNNTDISEEKADEIINSYFNSFIDTYLFKNLSEIVQDFIINNLWEKGDIELREAWKTHLLNSGEEINPLPNIDNIFAKNYLKDWNISEYILENNIKLPWDENISPEMQNRIDSGEIFGTNEPVDKTENIDLSKITNPYFNLLNVEQKLAVWHDFKTNVDFKGEYFDQNYDNLSNSGFYNWLIEHINHKGWEGDYPYFNLSDEHVRKHYFNDVFKEENVYFDEELLNNSIKAVKMRRVGIDVVTDKNKFDSNLESEAILQKMSNDDIIRNLAKERDDTIDKKNNINAEKLESFKHDVNSHSSLIKELIKAGNTLLENGFDLRHFSADGFTHKFGFNFSSGKITGVGRSLGDDGTKYYIYSDGENISIGPYTFNYDWKYDSEPRRWLEGLQSFKTQLSEIYGLNFDNVGMEEIQKSTKSYNKPEILIDLDTANEIVLDEEILLNDDKSVGFYAWSTNKLVEQFIPSEKRLQLADEDNNINFYFNYFDENNINMELSFYKGDVQVYESYKVSPESKGFDKLKEKLDEYCMEQEGIHVDEYVRVRASKDRLDMLYQPITPEKLMEFINIAELNTFDKEMAVECIETFKSENIPLVIDELGNVYQREMSENLKSNSEDDLTMLNPSGCIDFYKNELERISANADEEWYAEHKHTIDELNDIEDYLVNLENTVQLTTDNAYILADYVNNNKEIFGKFFTKTNGHIPAFEDMTKELAADILETLEIGDYLVRYDEQEKKFFIYDRQAAGENLFIEADSGNLLSKASDISNEWHRDDTTARENEICERLDKYLYPTESFLPIDLHINMCIPRSLSVNYEKAGNNVHKLIDEIGKTLKNTLISNTEIKEVNFKNQNDISFILKTSLVVKEPFFYENFININTVNSINENFSNSFGIALQNKFASYLGKDNSGLLENITFNKIGACEPGKNVAPSWEEIKSNFYEIDFNSARNTAYDVLHDQGIEITDYLLKQETVWQLLNDGYLTISENMDLNNDSDRAFINSAIEDVSDKYIKGEIKCHEMQYLFTEKENDYLENKEKDIVKNIPSPLDYHNPEDVQKFADFLNNNLQLSGNNSFTLEDAKFILHYDANINDKPDQLTIINGELYTHTFVGNLNNPQRDTPDTWEIYGSGKDTVLDVIDRTIDLTFDEKLSDEEQVILNKLISIDDSKHFLLEEKKEVTSSSVIETYLNKVKENLSEKDKKIVEKVLLASQKALSNFNKDEKAIIGQFFLDSGAVSQDKLGKIISKKVIENEKQNNKSRKQDNSFEFER